MLVPNGPCEMLLSAGYINWHYNPASDHEHLDMLTYFAFYADNLSEFWQWKDEKTQNDIWNVSKSQKWWPMKWRCRQLPPSFLQHLAKQGKKVTEAAGLRRENQLWKCIPGHIYKKSRLNMAAGFLTSLPVITMWRWLKGVVFFCMLSATNESGNQTLLGLLEKTCKLPVYGIITKSKQRCLCVPLGCDGLCTIRRLFPLQSGFNRSDSTPSSVRVQLQS